MKYYKKITLKDGRECIIRNGTFEDGKAALDVFTLTHIETDYLMSYPDEITFTAEEEADYLKNKTESEKETELVAEVDGKIVGLGGIEQAGIHFKTCHRADFGVSIIKEYWGLGIGRALTKANIECAKSAGYDYMELEVVSDNTSAYKLYLSEGFKEYGRKPWGFKTRDNGYQELILMGKEL